MILLFSATTFLSAFLLFQVQPMASKMLLPSLGGAPATWNGSMVFFQGTLLAGYLYAHLTTTGLTRRTQHVLHAVLLLTPLAYLPWHLPVAPAPAGLIGALAWELRALARSVGVPFFLLATTAPLLQRWLTDSDHPDADDPYFLYAASNGGSLAGLFSYPFLVEPMLGLERQRQGWALGYAGFAALVLCCAVIASRRRRPCERREGGGPPRIAGLGLRRPAAWVLLAAVPSSLMLGTTGFISTDIAAIPLLWVVPLGLYLVTFMLAFSSWQDRAFRVASAVLPVLAMMALLAVVTFAAPPLWLMLLHLAALLAAAMVCHGALARSRPAAEQLTAFYLWISVGGVLGGLFNTLVAPAIFSGMTEYPLALLAACFFRAPTRGAIGSTPPAEPSTAPAGTTWRLRDLWIVPAAIGVTLALALTSWSVGVERGSIVEAALVLAIPFLLCCGLAPSPPRFALALATLTIAAIVVPPSAEEVPLLQERNLFGVLRVTESDDGQYRRLVHGSTLHGLQFTDPERATTPLGYYHPRSPIAQVFEQWATRHDSIEIGVVGLGTGALSCFSARDQRWTFFEIDPTVERVARNPRLFTFLGACQPDARIVLGDARLSLGRMPANSFDLLVMDAFASDAIPLHLLTTEAVELFVSKLSATGIVAFHISNRHLDLMPVMAAVAKRAGLVGVGRTDELRDDAADDTMPLVSRWAILARHLEDLEPLASDSRWLSLENQAAGRAWTDDYSNVVAAWKPTFTR